ncbi:hypothetical protein BgiBS90_014528, partial [Biomphalaria glabrata]
MDNTNNSSSTLNEPQLGNDESFQAIFNKYWTRSYLYRCLKSIKNERCFELAVWVISVIVTAGFAVAFSHSALLDYKKGEIRQEVLTMSDFKFDLPEITICQLKYWELQKNSEKLTELLLRRYNPNSKEYKSIGDLNRRQQIYLLNEDDIKELTKMDNEVISLRFNSDDDDDIVQHKEISYVIRDTFFYDYGACKTITINGDIETLFPMEENELTIVFDFDSLRISNESNFDELPSGIIITLHENNMHPNFANKLLLGMNKENFISLKKKVYENEFNCYKNEDIDYFGFRYSQEFCATLCSSSQIRTYCNCKYFKSFEARRLFSEYEGLQECIFE